MCHPAFCGTPLLMTRSFGGVGGCPGLAGLLHVDPQGGPGPSSLPMTAPVSSLGPVGTQPGQTLRLKVMGPASRYSSRAADSAELLPAVSS